MKGRFSEEQIISILREAESAASNKEVCRVHGIAEHTLYRWKEEYGGLTVSELHRLKTLEAENGRLKRLVADQMLANEALKEVLAKRGLL